MGSWLHKSRPTTRNHAKNGKKENNIGTNVALGFLFGKRPLTYRQNRLTRILVPFAASRLVATGGVTKEKNNPTLRRSCMKRKKLSNPAAEFAPALVEADPLGDAVIEHVAGVRRRRSGWTEADVGRLSAIFDGHREILKAERKARKRDERLAAHKRLRERWFRAAEGLLPQHLRGRLGRNAEGSAERGPRAGGGGTTDGDEIDSRVDGETGGGTRANAGGDGDRNSADDKGGDDDADADGEDGELTGALRDALRKAYKRIPLQDRWRSYSPELSWGDRVPCDNDDCWYRGNLDRIGEWTESLKMEFGDTTLCSVCFNNKRGITDQECEAIDHKARKLLRWLKRRTGQVLLADKP